MDTVIQELKKIHDDVESGYYHCLLRVCHPSRNIFDHIKKDRGMKNKMSNEHYIYYKLTRDGFL
jgi:hypothetical protein